MTAVTLRRQVRDLAGHTVEFVKQLEIVAGGFSHGEQLTRNLIGPAGPLRDLAVITTSRDGEEYENVRAAGLNVKHHVTFWNSEIVGSPSASSAGYPVKHTANLGKVLTLNNSRVVARSAATKGLVMYGAGAVRAYRTVFDGGTDNVFVKPQAGSYPAALLGYSAMFEECMFGRLQRSTGSHNDCLQVDSDGQADGGCLVLRCRLDSHCCPGDPYTTEADPAVRGGTALIITGGGASKRVDVVDCYGDGGNITFQMQGGPGTTGTLRGARLGLDHQFQPILVGNDVTKAGNCWAATGVTACCGQVTAGQLIP